MPGEVEKYNSGHLEALKNQMPPKVFFMVRGSLQKSSPKLLLPKRKFRLKSSILKSSQYSGLRFPVHISGPHELVLLMDRLLRFPDLKSTQLTVLLENYLSILQRTTLPKLESTGYIKFRDWSRSDVSLFSSSEEAYPAAESARTDLEYRLAAHLAKRLAERNR